VQAGQWVIPQTETATAHRAGRAATSIGEWGSTRATAAVASGIGTWVPQDLPLTGGLNLSDVLRQNPEVSEVHLVKLVADSTGGQPSTLVSVANVARSVLAQRFGFR
jgi:hypothetical protein